MSDGHWRNISPGGAGTGPNGEPTSGRTWVSQNRLRPNIVPMDHQIDLRNAARSQKNHVGILAVHGTGTGKTIGATSLFEDMKGQHRAKRALVLAPSGLRNNFLEEGVNRSTTSKGVILSKPQELDPSVEYAIVSYDAFRRQPHAWIDKVKPDTIIADEVHRAGNPQSSNFRAIQAARDRVPHFIGLTAASTPNRPADILPLVQLARGSAGQPVPSRKAFSKQHIENSKSRQRGIFGGSVTDQAFKNPDVFGRMLGDTVHYQGDLDASLKPRKLLERVPVTMSKDQVAMYREALKGIDPVALEKIRRGERISDKHMKTLFERLMRARQVSNSIGSVREMPQDVAAAQTPKMKQLLDDAQAHIRDTPDGQVVITTNNVRGGLDVLSAGLKARGIPYSVFAGKGVEGITEETRQQAVRDYKEGKARAIIITRAGAEGLSLGNTTLVQMADGHYNPEVMNQFMARGIRTGGQAHRAPEKREVQVKQYMSTLPKSFLQKVTFRPADKSVEEYMFMTADRKSKLNDAVRDAMAKQTARNRERREHPIRSWLRGV